MEKFTKIFYGFFSSLETFKLRLHVIERCCSSSIAFPLDAVTDSDDPHNLSHGTG